MPTRTEIRRWALGVLAPGFVGTELPAWLHDLLREGLGGVWLFGHNIVDEEQCLALTEAIHRVSPQALVCSDEEGGTVTRLHHGAGSPWPGAWALGRADDPALTEAVAARMGSQLAAVGIDTGAAPVADVNSEPDNPVIGVRSFGPDPALVARQVAATVRGLRSAGVLSCAKHFPGHGSTRQDSHLTLPTLDVDEALLAGRELVPFRAAVEAGVDIVMTGHLVVPGHGDLPATLNPSLVRLLREDLGFTGVICTDAIDMEAVAATWGREQSAVLAIAAGVDLVCVGNPVFPGSYDAHTDVLSLVEALVSAVEQGELAAERLEEAAGRVRALRGRPAAQPSAPATSGGHAQEDDQLGIEAARRAVSTTGAPRELRSPLVVGASTRGNIASGARQEVVINVIADQLHGTTASDLDDPSVQTHPGPVVLVCDDHTDFDQPHVREAARGAAVLLHTGVRALPDQITPTWLVRTYGGGRASATAAAQVLSTKEN